VLPNLDSVTSGFPWVKTHVGVSPDFLAGARAVWSREGLLVKASSEYPKPQQTRTSFLAEQIAFLFERLPNGSAPASPAVKAVRTQVERLSDAIFYTQTKGCRRSPAERSVG
jgi:hypothetical protein